MSEQTPNEIEELAHKTALALSPHDPTTRGLLVGRLVEAITNQLQAMDAARNARSQSGRNGGSAVTPEIRAWAKSEVNEEEIAAGLRHIDETGGLTFEQLTEGLDKETE